MVGILLIKVQQIKIGSKEPDTSLNNSIQNIFDLMNRDFYHLEPMLVPIFPELPTKARDLEI